MIDTVAGVKHQTSNAYNVATKKAGFKAAKLFVVLKNSTANVDAAPPNRDPMIPADAGAQMRAAREAAGLTMQQMADELGITKSQLSHYENSGLAPKLECWAKFVEKCALGVFKFGVSVPKDGEAVRQLRAAREAAGLTQQQMADELGITLSQLNSYENGGITPKPDVWAKFVQKCALGVFKFGVNVPKDGEAVRQMRVAREAAGLTQQQMADELGITSHLLNSYEHGGITPSREVWVKFIEKCSAGAFKIGVSVPEKGEAGRQMSAVRDAAGLTQQQMADQLGIKVSQLNNYENGTVTPSREFWAKFVEKCASGAFKIALSVPKDGEAGQQMKAAREAAA